MLNTKSQNFLRPLKYVRDGLTLPKRLGIIPQENTVQSDEEHFLHFKGCIITMKLLYLNNWPWVPANHEGELHYNQTQKDWPLLTPAHEQTYIECKANHVDFHSSCWNLILNSMSNYLLPLSTMKDSFNTQTWVDSVCSGRWKAVRRESSCMRQKFSGNRW